MAEDEPTRSRTDGGQAEPGGAVVDAGETTPAAAGGDAGNAPADADERPTESGADGGGDTVGDGDSGDETPGTGGSVQWLFLLGLLVFVAGLVAFVADLVTGHDVVRSLVANAVGAVLLVSWAGIDSYRDTDSGVATVGGAVGTGLILVGLYLLGAGVVVAATSLVHDRLMVGVAMAAGGLPLVLGGFVAYPIAGLPAAGDGGDDPNQGEGSDGGDDPNQGKGSDGGDDPAEGGGDGPER